MLKAQDVLSHYLDDMSNYERKYAQKYAPLIDNMELMFTEEHQNERRQVIEGIFQRYLSLKSLAIEQGRISTTHFQEPPEHDDEIIKIDEKSNKKCSIFTRNKNGGAGTRYDLVLEGNEWKIDSKAFEGMNWRTMRNQF